MTATLGLEAPQRAPHPDPLHPLDGITAAAAAALEHRCPTLLVVEDEFLIAMQVSQVMENLGWSIVGPATSLEEAHNLLAEDEEPDVAILDINLHGKSVLSLADALHERGVPILFCTGYDMPSEIERFTGCAWLHKPVGVHQMFTEINALMERKTAATA